MPKMTTRSEQYTQGRPTLFVALELGAKEWKVGFTTGLGQRPRRRGLPAGEVARLRGEIAAAKQRFGLPSESRVVSCYEAGRDGFWLHRVLTRDGVENMVVDSSSIEVKRRARRAKSDGLDVAKLLVMLVRHDLGERGVWSVVRVPSREAEDARQLPRELRTLTKERTRTTNRMKGLLASQGVRVAGTRQLTAQWLQSVRLEDGTPLGPRLRQRLERDCALLEHLDARRRELEAERRGAVDGDGATAMKKIERLARLKGIGEASSWVLVREVFGWRQFQNRRQVAALAGLTPTPYQSGDSTREQGITKAGNRHVRQVAIELAWNWLRYQPASGLAQWFQRRFAAAGRRAQKVGIVAVARRLLIDLWRYLEGGVIPAGAALKTSTA
jgi:transposase